MENELAIQSKTLLEIAIEKGIDTDKLEKLIELKNREEERQCKREFDFHFGEMQKEFKPIDRTKDGFSSKYAPLALMVQKYATIISSHGFSYHWRESAIEAGKRVTIIISGWGYTDDQTYFDVPHIEGTKAMNAIQVKGTLSSYGQRYTFKAGFGITETDEDTDGNLSFSDGVMYAEQTKAIHECKTLKQLGEAWKLLYPTLTKDGKDVLTVIKDKKKAELVAEAGK